MSLLHGLGNVGVFVGKLVKPGASEMPQAGRRVSGEGCDIANCDRTATQVFDSVRVDDGPLYVCNRHSSDVRRWVG